MATQKGRNWSSGDIVTAANLSSIERGVSAVAEEYTLTTWANGNTVTAAALNNIEQGIANAGSGSSDFSTAEVTITNNSSNMVVFNSFFISNNELTFGLNVDNGASDVGETVLYKGSAYPADLLTIGGDFVENFTLSGGITEDDGLFFITGDCTITISQPTAQ